MAKKILIAFLFLIIITACSPKIQQPTVSVVVISDGDAQTITLPEGNAVQQALNAAGVSLSQIDRVSPPVYTLLVDGMQISVTRVREEFETQQVVIPYERQELHNESLPSGENRLVQAGQNGLRELTIRHVYENEVSTGSSVVSDTILQNPISEIIMIGVQSPFAPLPIPGRLAYLTSGNAWIMENSTSNRRPLVTTGDLDGHIFSLSYDGKWLLFSRKSDLPAEQEINTLWVVSTVVQSAAPISLKISNVIHFAAWQPGKQYNIAYSTVEPIASAPGWQANNDLKILNFQNWERGNTREVIEANPGGIYGWWGMNFIWSPDGRTLAYARPDGIGLVDTVRGKMSSLMDITPLNTHSDWAWTPGFAWGNDSQAIYLASHAAPTGLVSPEESPNFDLVSTGLSEIQLNTLVTQTGMFVYPAVSPGGENQAGGGELLAFMQAIFPTQSATSRYLLNIMNTDGSDVRSIFPAEGQVGLEPQTPVWAPKQLESGSHFIGITYEGNLWLVDITTGLSQQVTGDGLTSKLDWK